MTFEPDWTLCVFSLFKGFTELLVFWFTSNHGSRQQQTSSFTINKPWKELANGRTKEDLAPCILIGQPKRSFALRLLISPFPLVF